MVTLAQIVKLRAMMHSGQIPKGTPVIIVGRTEIVLVTDYNEEFVKRIKSDYPANVRTWDPLRVAWALTSTNENLFTVSALLHQIYKTKPVKVAEEGTTAEEVTDEEKKFLPGTLYAKLKTFEGATLVDLKKAYRKQAMIHHPDKGGNPEDFIQIRDAWLTLSNPIKRAKYDAAQAFLLRAKEQEEANKPKRW